MNLLPFSALKGFFMQIWSRVPKLHKINSLFCEFIKNFLYLCIVNFILI